MPWRTLWRGIRQRVDHHEDRRVTLTVAEIRAMTGTDQNLDKPWWWSIASDAAVPGNDVRLQESGLDWQLHTRSGHVYSVTFTRKE